MVEISLKSFFETGRFGDIELGMSRAQVREILGEPDDMGGTSRKYKRPAIWKYGDVEFHFPHPGDSLWMIFSDTFSIPSGGTAIDLDPWILSAELTMDAARRELTSAGIDYNEVDMTSIGSGIWLRLDFGTTLGFMSEDGDETEPKLFFFSNSSLS